ncbi:MAG: DUF2232 domain-containing protein [Erysipelotrichaceae bacterium]|nr:DUF2232 domain-containing protein [Erysipelotrichaceae bacterium]
MNKTKQMTQDAMMLAIIGAMILIDRMTAYWFTELIVLIVPVVVILYSAMHTVKDGLILSTGLTFISFLLGNFQFTYLIYVPVGILTGIVYSIGMKRKLDKQTLLTMAIIVYVVGEIVATFIVYPLLGFPVATMIEQFKTAVLEMGSRFGIGYEAIFTGAGLSFDKVVVILFVISTIGIGAMEGVLIHLLSVFLLKRFKIADLGRVNIWDIKPNPVVAYASFLSLFLFFANRYTENQTLYYVGITIALLGAIILMYYGYLFVILYGVIVLRRNVGSFFILLAFFVPVLLIFLVILGFLYGSGPLRNYLESKIPNKQS